MHVSRFTRPVKSQGLAFLVSLGSSNTYQASLFYLSKLQCASHQLILDAEIGLWVNRAKLLISCLQNPVFYFDLVGVGRSPKGACRPAVSVWMRNLLHEF